MTPDRWKQIEALYHEARALPTGERPAFLAESCPDDEGLRREVESLLSEPDSGDGFLAGPALAMPALTAPEMLPMIGRSLGGYQLLALLGAGGMGEVYRARDATLGRDVAIKILPREFTSDPDRLARFAREARMLAAVNHPGICAIYGFEEADPSAGSGDAAVRFLVLELVEGETLAKKLEAVSRRQSRQKGLPLDEALRIARQIADALEVAHEKGIVHRDLKPANITITPAGVVKVLDFGLAKALGAADAEHAPAGETREGVLMGTAAYMSPEQARGLAVDKRTDIWAFGCVLYEMLTGRGAFAGDTASDSIAKILEREPDWAMLPAGTPPSIKRLLRRCLAKDPKQRLRDIADVRIEIDASNEELPSDGPPLRPIGIRRGLTILGALVVVALAVAIYVTTRTASGAPSALQDLDIKQLTSDGNAQRPAISPDGRYVAYIKVDHDGYSLWVRQTAVSAYVRIVSPEAGQPIHGATFTPDSESIDFLRTVSGVVTLWRAGVLGGQPKKLIDHVVSPIGWSADGQRMAFLQPVGGSSTALVVADRDGQHERVVNVRHQPATFTTIGNPLATSRPAWSPDGRLIALAGFEDSTPQIVLVDVAKGSEHTIAATSAIGGLAWLDAGSLVVNESAESGAPHQFWRVPYPEGAVSRVTNGLDSYIGVSMTSDRGQLATMRNDIRSAIWIGDAAAKDVGEVLPPSLAGWVETLSWAASDLVFTSRLNGQIAIRSLRAGKSTPDDIISKGRAPAPTPDGRTIVFVSAETGSGSGPIWRAEADGRNRKQLAPRGMVPVVGRDRSVIFLSAQSGVASLWVVSIDGGPARQLTKRPASRADVSPDGNRLVFRSVDEQGHPVLVVCDLPDCTSERTLPDPVLSGSAKWRPDGLSLAYVPRMAASNIWVLPLSGAAPHQLTQFTDGRRIDDFAWSRDGKRLAIVRSTTTTDIVLFKGLRGRPR
jgi:serine/threonine protein kinase